MMKQEVILEIQQKMMQLLNNEQLEILTQVLEHVLYKKEIVVVEEENSNLLQQFIDKGMPIEQVQVLLGHTKIDSTLQYAMVSQKNVKLAHQKYIS